MFHSKPYIVILQANMKCTLIVWFHSYSSLSPSRRSLFGGWHFFSPAHVMKLVEIVRGTETSMETVCVMQRVTKRVGKIGVVVGNCDGFVGNRLLISYGAETTLLLEEGVASVSSVDKAFLKFGIALGPFQMADLAGLDIGYNIRKQRGWVTNGGTPSKNKPARYPEIADVIVSDYKRLGQKTGKVSSGDFQLILKLLVPIKFSCFICGFPI